ncbi:DNA methyltransferase [Vibrio parahaemolyticus]|uniref:DNA methyltransferase n=1 Tax=Vibrio parahaemolyticus TaxID=670 RepID=UPI001C580E9A|nr:DNA methyltransferase [Vibrio parahaemolyticus]
MRTHTTPKVPHKAIMRYFLHYTQPGDVVLDGFSGSGMAGIAAQMCANKKEVIEGEEEGE